MRPRTPLLAALMRRLGAGRSKQTPGPAEPGGKLFRDQPGDWKDAVYSPKGLRRKK